MRKKPSKKPNLNLSTTYITTFVNVDGDIFMEINKYGQLIIFQPDILNAALEFTNIILKNSSMDSWETLTINNCIKIKKGNEFKLEWVGTKYPAPEFWDQFVLECEKIFKLKAFL